MTLWILWRIVKLLYLVNKILKRKEIEMEIEVGKEIKFAAAHRLIHHKGACHNLHGHNYKIIVYMTESVKKVEKKKSFMVKDYKEIKDKVGKWISEFWDHALIINTDDRELAKFARSQGYKLCEIVGEPTAENMCLYLLKHFPELSTVTVFETDSSQATSVRRN